MKWADLNLDRGILDQARRYHQAAYRSRRAAVGAGGFSYLRAIKRGKAELRVSRRRPDRARRRNQEGWATLCKSASIAGLRIHDLRALLRLPTRRLNGASLPLIGALLGHAIRRRLLDTVTCSTIRNAPPSRRSA